MKPSIAIIIALLLTLPVWQLPAQQRPVTAIAYSIAVPASAEKADLPPPAAGDQDDPAYQIYKAGYTLVLDGKWDAARKKFDEVMKKYPKSEYVDEARYWTAYALKHTDKKKAIEAYTVFIKDYPDSKYYDDAVADLGQLDPSVVVTSPSSKGGTEVHIGPGQRGVVTSEGMVVGTAPRGSLNTSMRKLERSLARISRSHWQVRPSVGVPVPLYKMTPESDENIDPETRLKMDALYALGEAHEDSTSYRALRDVVLDKSQPRELRDAAMDALSNFKKYDVLSVYLDVAKKDTSEEMQNAAIDYIGQITENKGRAVETLTELFRAIPQHRTEQRETVLSSIAEIGNDRAVDFLAGIAKSDADYELRSQAVYYLGSIGGEKARAALYDILRAK